MSHEIDMQKKNSILRKLVCHKIEGIKATLVLVTDFPYF